MLDEVKGADLRSSVRGTRRQNSHAVRFLGEVLQLLARYHAKVIGRVWIKELYKALKPDASYTYAIQDIASHMQRLLQCSGDHGLIICDSREHAQDASVAHSIFTQKHQGAGDAYPNLVETVTFGRSVNHVGLQLADLIVAGLIYPMAAVAYCPSYVSGLRNGRRFEQLRLAHGSKLKGLRYTWLDAFGKVNGGIVVSDKAGKRHSGLLYP